jgi:hypothetical protein
LIFQRCILVCLLAAALGRGPALAISLYSGRVTFGDVPVPGASVIATKGDRTRATTTNEQGIFTFADLDDGVWSIRVEMPAFAALAREVTIGAGAEPGVWRLTLKPFDEIAREASRSPAPAFDPSPPPGAPPTRASTERTPAAAPANAPAGARPAATAPDEPPADSTSAAAADGYLVNGSVNNGAASPIAQPPAFGNNRRQGNSLYNGGVAVILGSSAFDSRPFTFAGTPTAQPDYQNLRINGTFGGPIKFSKNLRKDPILFLSFQRTDDHNATTQPGTVPTAGERAGDFSHSVTAAGQPVRIVDPITGQEFSGGVIPSSKISPQAAALLNYYPLPTIDPSGGFNFQAPLLSGTTQNLVTSRVTQLLSTKDQLVGLFAYQHNSTDQTSLFGFTDASGVSGVDTSVTWTHRVNQSKSWRLRYQFIGVTNSATPYFAYRTNVSGDAGITGNNQDPANWGPPTLQFSTITGLTDALPAYSRNNTNSGGAEVTWTRGHHNLTFGGDGRHVATDVKTQLNPRGSFSFSGAISGSDLADFLLGLPSTSAIAYDNAEKQFRATAFDAYLTDDWRFSPTLTMQVGARWEYEPPPTERAGRMVNLVVGPDFSSVTPVASGDGLLHPDRTGLQPRIGVAWRPIAGSSLLVRGGYGVYRNNAIYQPIVSLLAQQPPLSKTFTISTSAAYPLTLANGFNVPAFPTSNTFAVDPDLRIGAAQNWQALVQRDLMGFLTMTASYLGTKGDHLLQEFLPNTYPIGAVNPCPGCPSGFVYLTSNGHSTRHAGQWQVRWRLHRGLAASVQYTLASARDNATAFAGVNVTGGAIAQDWQNLDGEEARSNFDQRHQIVAQVQYTTGVGIGGGALVDGLKGRLLKGWTVTGQLATGSGRPFTPVYLVPVPGTGVVGSLRPGLTGASLDAADGRFLNPAGYAPPAPGQWGNAGRNSVTGPAQFTFDAGVTRSFQWTKRLNFDWRIDATNVLNRETYTGVNAIFGGPQFGLPNLANTPRRLLSTMRVRF